jgi:polyhydroxybutyrate depolymerase
LIVVVHGGYGTGAGAIAQGNWAKAVNANGFMVVAPDGLFRAWNAGGCCGFPMSRGVDDVAFIVQVVETLEITLPIDPARVYATGISNGGMMSYRLGCEASATFAAIAPVAATLFTTTPCQPSRRVSVLHIHGLADQNVPFNGGVGPKAAQPDPPAYPPVTAGVQRWAALDGCRVRLRPTTAGVVTDTRWTGCRSGTAVELVTIDDGGHSWPGGQRMAAILDPPSTALDATATIVSFFAAHHR